MFKRISITAAAAFLMASAGTASAQTTVFNFTAPPASNSGSGNGNTKTWTVDGITVTAAAWSMSTPTAKPVTGILGRYTYGLGVTDRQEDGSAPYHTVDNVGLYDFITLTFSRPVQILYGSLVPFDVTSGRNSPADNDAWVSFTMDPTNTPITNDTVWANLLLHATEVEGNLSSSASYSTYLNPGMNTGDVWIVGADKFNADDRDDGFKLAGLSVQLPVPEPATWMMLVAGIGIMGGALRVNRKSATAARSSAAA